ncbi:MAG: glycosyltransferase, partial [Candidatus Omnitrophica bacterium]|nr:glycosyltransferase [Candidatus Omnitrophota bacterium]
MTEPLVSVVIPCYNAQDSVAEAIESALGQRLESIEVIVVDDGSEDQSAAVVRTKFPEVRVVNTPNRGGSAARNLGTRLSSGKFVQYLDADDVLAAGKLRAQIAALETSGADVAYGDWEKLIKEKSGALVRQALVRRQLQEDAQAEFLWDCWCPPAVYLFRREMIKRTGPWDEALDCIQDARFLFDCARAGASFIYCPGLMASYRRLSRRSVSTRNPLGFARTFFRCARAIEEIWRKEGEIRGLRHRTLLQIYSYLARATFEIDRATFERCYATLKNLEPR